MGKRLSYATTALLMLASTAFGSTNFVLNDQFDRAFARGDIFKDAPVVIIAGAQRKTPDAMEAWDKALRGRLPEGIRVFGLSNLKKLPFFVPKGSVKRTLAQKLPNTAVLLDWKGKVYPGLGFADSTTIAVGVFGRGGARLGIVEGESNEQRLAEVLSLASR
jgi:hypothetical protein